MGKQRVPTDVEGYIELMNLSRDKDGQFTKKILIYKGTLIVRAQKNEKYAKNNWKPIFAI